MCGLKSPVPPGPLEKGLDLLQLCICQADLGCLPLEMPGLAADLTDGAEAVHNCGLERSWERKIVPTSIGKSRPEQLNNNVFKKAFNT